MAGINHVFVSAKTDSADTTIVRPSNWNADHTITGNVDFNAFNAIDVGQVTLSSNAAFLMNGNYTSIKNKDGEYVFQFGANSIPDSSNYYDNTVHRFRTRNAAADIAYLQASSFTPATNDGLPLGTSSSSWSDLFLAFGGVINWANSECTLYEPAQGSIAISADPNNASAASGIQFIIDGTVTGLMASAAFRPQSNDGWALGNTTISWSDLFLASGGVINWNNSDVTLTHSSGNMALSSPLKIVSGTATPAGGTAGSGLSFGTTTNFGVYFGSGAPSLSAAKGSLYLRSDGTTTNDRAYINTNGSTTWTALTTAA